MIDMERVRRSILSHSVDTPLFSELQEVRKSTESIKEKRGYKYIMGSSSNVLDGIEEIPRTPYYNYREFKRSGERKSYEGPYFLKRSRLSHAALNYFISRDEEVLNHILNYVWSICEETNWVVPAHEHGTVDLFAAETAFLLAELFHFIGDDFPWEVRKRILDEIDRRIFVRYFTEFNNHHWHKGDNNWCGVCNCAIGCAFLYLEKDPERLADAVCQVLDGLEFFFENAFEKDGGSTEGTIYWQYGLINFIPFAELLRERTGGEIDLLSLPRIKTVAQYPLNVVLSRGYYSNFSDCDERAVLSPGIISRLADRTLLPQLKGLLEENPKRENHLRWRLSIILREILWWDNYPIELPEINDVYMESTAVVRFASRKPDSPPLTLAAKAGHNAECHNQNDVGSFIVHLDGEAFICDPGKGLYSKQYFASDTRYQNVFCNSYGHSVPVISCNLQKPDNRKYSGEILDVQMSESEKTVKMEISEAYDLVGLSSLVRDINMLQDGDFPAITLTDTFEFTDSPMEIEEAFMTFLPVEVDGSTAVISGTKADMTLSAVEPSGVELSVESLEKECKENQREGILKRISFRMLSEQNRQKIVVKMYFCKKQ